MHYQHHDMLSGTALSVAVMFHSQMMQPQPFDEVDANHMVISVVLLVIEV